MKNLILAKHLITWHQTNGRHDLPWQKNPTPYCVWISEIMLQQTQVITVIDYYQRFIKRFPTLKSLALAKQDDVLTYWSGLGYYARARNIHKTAQIIHNDLNGLFPSTAEGLIKLPGIGLSTAGAIVSFSQHTFGVICDGNVKRVLTRVFAFDQPINQTIGIRKLWEIATKLTPSKNAHHYNQAIMDLGATLCTRTKPSCLTCPISKICKAYLQGNPTAYPVKTPKKPKPHKQIIMQLIQNKSGKWLLIKRPNTGIWGGLWSFPEIALDDKESIFTFNDQKYSLNKPIKLTQLTHQFTHYSLDIYPIVLTLKSTITLDPKQAVWYNLSDPLPGGIATPVAKILKQLSGIINDTYSTV